MGEIGVCQPIGWSEFVNLMIDDKASVRFVQLLGIFADGDGM